MSKNKWIGIIALVVALIIVAVVVIVVLDPFGGKIEGEWYLYSVEVDGEVQDNDRDSAGNIAIFTFSEDGTVTIARPAPSYYDEEYLYGTATYSYSDGKITIDGETLDWELDCNISGNKMTWTGTAEGMSVKLELKR